MATGIPNVNANNGQHMHANAQAANGNATATNNVTNNSTLHTIASIAGGAIAVLAGLFLLSGEEKPMPDTNPIFASRSDDGRRNDGGDGGVRI